MRRVLVAILLTAATLGALASSPASADANSYDVWSCHSDSVNESAFAEYWQHGRVDEGEWPVNQCPTGWLFPNQQSIEQGALGIIWYVPNSFEESVRSVTFKHSGGDSQYVYWFGKCGETCNDRTPLQQIPSGASPSLPPEMIVDTSQDEVSTFAIWAECVADGCEPGVPFRVNDFEIELFDATGPTIEDLETEPAGLLDPDANAWLHGDFFRLKFKATDLHTGIASATVMNDWEAIDLGQTGWCSEYTDGPYTRAGICDNGIEFNRQIDVTALDDGEHELGIAVVDGINNLTLSLGHAFRIDNGEPDPPSGLTLHDPVTADGWTTSPQLEFQYDDPRGNPVNTAFSGWRSARYALHSRDGLNSPPMVFNDEPTGIKSMTIPAEGRWDLGVSLIDNADNRGDESRTFIGFDRDAPDAPQLDPNGWITFNELIDGFAQSWVAPAPNPELESGVCGYSVEFDNDLQSVPDATIDVHSTESVAPARLRSGFHYAHVRSVACNGLASNVATESLNVDGALPDPKIGGWSGPDWSRDSGSITLFGSDDLSGIQHLLVSRDGGSFSETDGPSETFTPEEGQQTIAWKAEDVAGNISDPEEVTIRRDWTAPTVEFESRDPGNPSAITAIVTDSASGPASALMSYRQLDAPMGSGEAMWRPLGTTELANPAAAIRLSRVLPDEQLPPGLYEFRVTALDHAGNSTEDEPNPISIMLALPVREQLAISAAVADVETRCRTAAGKPCRSVASCRRSQRCYKETIVVGERAAAERVRRFGERSALIGTLTDAGGDPIAGQRIEVLQRIEYGPLESLAEVTTDADGEYSLLLEDLPTREFIVRFAGDSLRRPAESAASLSVRAALSLRVSPKKLRSGRPFTLRGRLLSAGIGLPEGKKVIEFQFLRGSKWISTLQGARTDPRGYFKGTWPGVVVRKRESVYFRAVAKRDAQWPFLSGYSKPVVVRVSP